jgi:hypothetical protein
MRQIEISVGCDVVRGHHGAQFCPKKNTITTLDKSVIPNGINGRQLEHHLFASLSKEPNDELQAVTRRAQYGQIFSL